MSVAMGAPSERRVAFAGGGTAGHVYPAIAVAEAYRRAAPGAEMLFVGTRLGSEARLITGRGFHFAGLPGAPFFGVGAMGKLRAAVALVRSVVRARRLLRAERIQLVVGFGSYGSAGPVLAARSLGLPCAIYEPNLAAGLTNRLLRRFADRIYLGFEAARQSLGGDAAVVTGVPVRPEILRIGAGRGDAVPADRPAHVLVSGGSLGSPFLNLHAPRALARLSGEVRLEVWHQTGEHDTEPVARAYRSAGLEARAARFIDDIAEAYAWADAAIVCAGAGTLAELAAAALPALLVPFAAAAGDHQRGNATAFAEASGLPWIGEDEWRDDAAAETMRRLLGDAALRRRAAARLHALAPAGAAERLVADCEQTLVSRKDAKQAKLAT